LDWHSEQNSDPIRRWLSPINPDGYTMKQIVEWFGVHYATVSRATKQYENLSDYKT